MKEVQYWCLAVLPRIHEAKEPRLYSSPVKGLMSENQEITAKKNFICIIAVIATAESVYTICDMNVPLTPVHALQTTAG